MIDTTHPYVQTPRLILRPFVPSDAPFMFKWAGDKEVTTYLRFKTHENVAQSMKVITSWIEHDRFPQVCNFAIVKKDNLDVIGSIGLITTSVVDERGEVGYVLRKNEWNKGYMSEALIYTLTFGFEKMGLHRIEATHSVLNPASGRVMKKANMTLECPVLRHHYKSSQLGFLDSALWASCSDTYQKVQLENR